MGRPSIKTPELLAAICERLAVGESVRSICRSEDMPTDYAVFRWLATDVAFQKQYLQAKEVGCFVLAEQLLEIADDGTNDYAIDPVTGLRRVDHHHIQRSKLRVDTRKWYLSKIVAKIYGDKTSIEHSGMSDIAQRLIEGRRRAGGFG